MNTARRILVIDDNHDIHDDFRKVFASVRGRDSGLSDLEADLFGDEVASATDESWLDVEVESAYQGEDGVRMAVEAAHGGRPYYMAFVDVRMPPGIDGVQTIRKLWRQLPELPCVICTAFSDYSWKEMTKELGRSGQLLILKKPFDTVEVLQFAQALAERSTLADAAKNYQLRLEEQVEQLQRAEAELKRNNEDLRAARAGAESASRTKSEFLANMSHELRTPLNGVIGMTALLLDTPLSAQQRRYSQTIRSSASTLLELLNDILDFSKVEAGKLELEQMDFDPAGVVEATTELVAHRCREKRLELTCFVEPAIPRPLQGDPGRLRQILTNLAANAVKFTQAGEIAIRAVLVEETPETATIRFSVRDTGIGIPADRLDRLFKAFSQVDASTTRRFGGTGLGLAISRQLCELMGGRISVESEVGRGSLFSFTIAFPKSASADGAARRPGESGGARVLIVDDHAETREMLLEQFRAWRFVAEAAPDFANARDRLAAGVASGKPFDVVLVDAEGGGLDLERFTIEIGAAEAGVQVVAMVPIGMEIDAGWMARAGVSHYVTKPVMQSELYNTLLRVVRHEPGPRDAGGEGRGRTARRAIPQARHVQARILIAEDNVINQEVAREVLTKAGFSCDVVGDGGEAYEAVRRQRYDLVLMDCMMPEMDGFEATRLIREAEARDGGRMRLPILALTASALKGDRERCLEAGMSGYLSKPLDPDELIDSVDALLGQPSASGEAPSEPDGAEHAPSSGAMIDMDALVRRCMGNRPLAERLREEFLTQLEADSEKLAECLSEGRAEDIRRIAHTLKGTSASISCERVRLSAERLEASARANDLAAAMSQLRELQDCRAQLGVAAVPVA